MAHKPKKSDHVRKDPLEPSETDLPKAEPVVAKPVEIPATFTEEQQNAYARDAQTTGARNVKGYDDIHDWYRRTRGGTENG